MTRAEANMRRRRRQMEIRIKIAVAVVAFIMVIGSVIAISTIVSDANDSADEQSFKYFKSIEIEYGDTLWSIAEKYMDEHYDSKADYIEEVMNINSLISDEIIAGQFIVVPYYGSLDLSLN